MPTRHFRSNLEIKLILYMLWFSIGINFLVALMFQMHVVAFLEWKSSFAIQDLIYAQLQALSRAFAQQ